MSKRGYTRKRQAQTAPPDQRGDAARPLAAVGSETSAAPVPQDPASRGGTSLGPPPTHEQIAVRAHQLWEDRGRPAGTDREDWFEAERQLRSLAEAESCPGR